jgi:uncharacterized protein YecE (DUF72 family)
MKNEIRIGTSGFGISKVEYAQRFSCVEVQHTFYQPPRVSTLERWRNETPPEFEFTLKAWQLITHDSRSPTYRRLKRKLSAEEKQQAGYFRPTPIVREAWEITRACAEALQAKTILFQCPISFKPSEENIGNMRSFFEGVKREDNSGQFNFVWEPRGDWDSKVVEDLCNSLGLWHVVDPFVNKTMTPSHCYFRLHGRGGWRYEYDDAELHELAAMLPPAQSLGKPRRRPRSAAKGGHYVFFNNVTMTKDALRFQEMLNGSGSAKQNPDR